MCFTFCPSSSIITQLWRRNFEENYTRGAGLCYLSEPQQPDPAKSTYLIESFQAILSQHRASAETFQSTPSEHRSPHSVRVRVRVKVQVGLSFTATSGRPQPRKERKKRWRHINPSIAGPRPPPSCLAYINSKYCPNSEPT